jgi:hypothetical protein
LLGNTSRVDVSLRGDAVAVFGAGSVAGGHHQPAVGAAWPRCSTGSPARRWVWPASGRRCCRPGWWCRCARWGPSAPPCRRAVGDRPTHRGRV